MDVVQPYRIRNQNFISLFKESRHGSISPLPYANRNQNLGRVIRHMILLQLPFCNGFSKLRGSVVGCIKHIALCKAVTGCFFNFLRRIKIRTSDFHMNNPFAGLLHFRSFLHYGTDSGKRKAVHSFCCFVIHTAFLFSSVWYSS